MKLVVWSSELDGTLIRIVKDGKNSQSEWFDSAQNTWYRSYGNTSLETYRLYFSREKQNNDIKS